MRGFNSEMRIKVPLALPTLPGRFRRLCEPIWTRLTGNNAVNPILIVEGSLPSTRAYDLVDQVVAYQSIDHFGILPSPRPLHTLSQSSNQKDDGTNEIVGDGERVKMESVGATLALSELYERVDFQ